MDITSEVLRFEKDVSAPVADVWRAYADVPQRVRWSVPEGEEIVYDEAAFASGGEDRYRCGPPGELLNSGHLTYHLVELHNGFLYTETIRRDGSLLAVALLTWQMDDLGAAGTRVSVVDQVTSLVGDRPRCLPTTLQGARDNADQRHHA